MRSKTCTIDSIQNYTAVSNKCVAITLNTGHRYAFGVDYNGGQYFTIR